MEMIDIWHWLLVVVLTALLALPVVIIFYILTHHRLELAFRPLGARYPAGRAWFLFIPIVNIFLYFALLLRLRAALQQIHVQSAGMSWWRYGLAAGVFFLLGNVTSFVFPVIGPLFFVPWLVLGILHWTGLHSLAKNLERARAG
jgi:fumarate reductase subunit D